MHIIGWQAALTIALFQACRAGGPLDGRLVGATGHSPPLRCVRRPLAGAAAIREASAIAHWGDAVVVVGDEDDDAWRIANDGSVSPFPLGLPTRDAVDNLEALAVDPGGALIAVCSQSRRNRDGGRPRNSMNQLKRECLAELGPPGSASPPSIWYGLRDPLIAHLRSALGRSILETIESAVPASGGLNVEGAAMWGGVLWLGLRNPRTPDGVILVPLENPKPTIHGEAPPRFGQPVILAAKDQVGIRAMAEDASGILIVLGPSLDGDAPSPRLLRWTPETQPIDVTPAAFGGFDHVEGISVGSDGCLWVAFDREAGTGPPVAVIEAPK